MTNDLSNPYNRIYSPTPDDIRHWCAMHQVSEFTLNDPPMRDFTAFDQSTHRYVVGEQTVTITLPASQFDYITNTGVLLDTFARKLPIGTSIESALASAIQDASACQTSPVAKKAYERFKTIAALAK